MFRARYPVTASPGAPTRSYRSGGSSPSSLRNQLPSAERYHAINLDQERVFKSSGRFLILRAGLLSQLLCKFFIPKSGGTGNWQEY